MSGESVEKKPCRHCEKPTKQRAQGIPYCSMACIDARRRDVNRETFRCPFPGCDWEDDYLPGNRLSETVFNHAAEEHRKKHATGEMDG